MNRTLICAYEDCSKTITGKGVIKDGKTYHKECCEVGRVDARLADFEELHKAFPDMDGEILEDLYMFLVEEGATKKEDLYEMLRFQWAIITRGIADNGDGEIDIDTFTSKTKASQWLADQIALGMLEDYIFDVEYVLNKGEIFAGRNEFSIKVSF